MKEEDNNLARIAARRNGRYDRHLVCLPCLANTPVPLVETSPRVSIPTRARAVHAATPCRPEDPCAASRGGLARDCLSDGCVRVRPASVGGCEARAGSLQLCGFSGRRVVLCVGRCYDGSVGGVVMVG